MALEWRFLPRSCDRTALDFTVLALGRWFLLRSTEWTAPGSPCFNHSGLALRQPSRNATSVSRSRCGYSTVAVANARGMVGCCSFREITKRTNSACTQKNQLELNLDIGAKGEAQSADGRRAGQFDGRGCSKNAFGTSDILRSQIEMIDCVRPLFAAASLRHSSAERHRGKSGATPERLRDAILRGQPEATVEEKVCPQCAEKVKAAAFVCAVSVAINSRPANR